jgi:hypothetical protein
MSLDAAANTVATDLAELHSIGFAVRNQDNAGYSYVAERHDVVLRVISCTYNSR